MMAYDADVAGRTECKRLQGRTSRADRRTGDYRHRTKARPLEAAERLEERWTE